MILRLLARGGLGALVGVALATSASGTARAQGSGAGTMLELPVLDVRVSVPKGVGEWIARKDAGGDIVQRTRPVNPYLSVLFSEPDGKSDGCSQTMAALAKKGLKKLDRPSLVPAGWSTQVLSASSGGENLVAFCAEHEDDGRQLLALVTYAASLDGPDLSSVTPILEAVGKAVFARAKPAAATGKPAPPAAKASPEDEAADTATQELTLARSGLVLVVGGEGEWEAKPGKGGRDLLRRTTPAEPALSVAIEIVRTAHGEGDGGCEAILDQYMATRSKSSLQNKPGYLPDTFHPNAAESYDGGTGRALTCAKVPTGYLLATIAYSGSLDAEDARGARPLLVAAYHAATAIATHGKGGEGHGLFSGRSFDSPELYLAGQRLAPAGVANPDGLIDRSSGVVLGVRQATVLVFSEGSVFGLAGRYQLSGGWDAQNELFFDGIIGVGFGLVLDHVKLMALGGGGGDAIGAGAKSAPDKLNFPFEFYNAYGGVLAVDFTQLVAMELTYTYCDRGDIRELRYDGKLIALPSSFRKVSLGVSYLDIENVATVWQVLLGVGF